MSSSYVFPIFTATISVTLEGIHERNNRTSKSKALPINEAIICYYTVIPRMCTLSIMTVFIHIVTFLTHSRKKRKTLQIYICMNVCILLQY